jgi:hypothetical protein
VESRVQQGYLLLADISGFTSFMASSELEHAQQILTEVINVVCKSLKPALKIAEIEGDAIFAFAFDNQLSRGETLLELIELTYYNFYFHKKIMQERTTCTCNACLSIKILDLKFISHFGKFALQDYSGVIKPLGTDVNLAHRLLKNCVTEKTGLRSYSLFSKSCFEKLDLPEDIFIPLEENYEHLGEVRTYTMDLSESVKRLSETKRYFISESDADFTAEYHFEMPAPVLWEWLTDHNKRMKLMDGTVWTKGERKNGRTEAGSTNHCAHGNESLVELIHDWRPFEYYTYELGKKPLFFISTLKLSENENGTTLYELIKLKSNLPKFLKKIIAKFLALKGMKVYDVYKKIEEFDRNERKQREADVVNQAV